MTDSGMVERVARAIFYSHKASGPLVHGGMPGEPQRRMRLASASDLDGWEEVRERYLEMARAAIAAMREPTDDMRRATPLASDIANIEWPAMIDAALSEEENE